MGTSKRNVLMACVAAITTLIVTACGGPEPAPTSAPQPSSQGTNTNAPTQPPRVVTTVVPTVHDNAKLMGDFSIVAGANTLYCNPAMSHLELVLNGETKGFKGGTIKTQVFNNGLARIDWDEMAARSLIVNKQQWTPVDTLADPPIATNLRIQDWGGKITSIEACSWGM